MDRRCHRLIIQALNKKKPVMESRRLLTTNIRSMSCHFRLFTIRLINYRETGRYVVFILEPALVHCLYLRPYDRAFL